MNLRKLFQPIALSLLPLGLAAGLAGATPASAQSIIVTAPFTFCVNSAVFAQGTYEFALESPWLLSIRNIHGKTASLFAVRPEDGTSRGSFGGLTFHTVQGMRELQAVHEYGKDGTVVLLGKTPKLPLPGCGGSEPGSKDFSQRESASNPSDITIGANQYGGGSSNHSK
jgi:hypothetical protein